MKERKMSGEEYQAGKEKGKGAKMLLVIDTDCGVDDALALILAVTSSAFDVIAITCSHGNVSIDFVWKNVFRVLKLCKRLDIPVYNGSDRSLIGTLKTDTDFNGFDGLGGASVNYPIDENCKVQSEPAAVAMVRLAKENPGAITLVALGPLTNLAIAQRLDPIFSSRLAEMVFMGGNITGLGNIEVATEFNFNCDPEAAAVVLEEFKCPTKCIPWETCYNTKVPWTTYADVLAVDTVKAKFIEEVTKLTVDWIKSAGIDGYYPCDFYAVAAVLNHAVVTKTEFRHVYVETQGTITNGEMIVEKRLKEANHVKPNVDLVMSFDKELMISMLKSMVSSS